MMEKIMRKQIALPSDHGSWVFLLSPLLIGIFSSGRWQSVHWYLLLAALAAFLLRQPAATAVKCYSGRRSSQDLPAARFWIVLYGMTALAALLLLYSAGFFFLVWLALPGILIFIWHLWLVSKRAERYQIGVDVIASGTLALAAPAAYWIGVGEAELSGWWLWGLTWLQSATSIVYAFLRLAQRRLKEIPDTPERFQMAKRALLYSFFNFFLVLSFSISGQLPTFLWLPYALQALESLWGSLNPAVGLKPTTIGFRQMGVSVLFTVLFIVVWWL